MNGFIEGETRSQATLFPERIDDYISEDNPVRVVDVFVSGLDLGSLVLKPNLLPRVVLPITRLPC